MKFYTIYKTTNTLNGKIYIGQHSTTNIDDNYLGSGKYITEAIKEFGKENFIKEILYVFDNFEDMNNKEKELVNSEFIKSDNNYNKAVGGYNALINNNVLVKFKNCNKFIYVTSEEYNNNKSNYSTTTSGKVTAKKIGDTNFRSIDVNEYHNSKEYTTQSSGKVVVFNIEIDKYEQIQTEEYKNNKDKYISYNTNKVWVYNSKNEFINVSIEEYKNNKDKYKTPSSGMVTVTDLLKKENINISVEEYKNNKDKYKSVFGGIVVNDGDQLKYVTRKEFDDNNMVGIHKGKLTVRFVKTGEVKHINKEDFDEDIHQHLTKGRTTAFNKDTKKYENITLENFHNKDNYIGCTTGYVTVKHIDEDHFKNIPIEEYNKNKHLYKNGTSGKVRVIEIKTNNRITITVEEYNKNKHLYKSINGGNIHVYDNVLKKKRIITPDLLESNKDRYKIWSSKKLYILDKNGNKIFEFFGTSNEYKKLYNGITLYNFAKINKPWIIKINKPQYKCDVSEKYLGLTLYCEEWKI